jgi:hypothetical protein
MGVDMEVRTGIVGPRAAQLASEFGDDDIRRFPCDVSHDYTPPMERPCSSG